MQLIFSTWKEVEKYLKRSKGIIVPIGSTEQHGPTGWFGTDTFCAEVMAEEFGKATGALVGPAISVGMSVHHTAFPGSISLRPTTLIQAIVDYISCLTRYGFERFFIVNGHGGNGSAIHSASWEIYAKAPEMKVKHPERVWIDSINWWDLPSVAKMKDKMFGKKDGGHATPAELSVAMYAHQERRMNLKKLPPWRKTRNTGYGPLDFRASYPDGRLWSTPELARVEHGRRLVRAAVKDFVPMYKTFLKRK